MRPKRSLGQNFLHDDNVIERIIAALDLDMRDHVVEIGPGLGSLTEKLLESAATVSAVEFDRDMVALLRERFADALHIVQADVLHVDLRSLGSGSRKLVGNLPYNISTPILQKLIDVRDAFSTLVLMFQREVVDRITARAGSAGRGYLTVLTEAAFDAEHLFDVPPTAFRPEPKVWSSVVRLSPKPYFDLEHDVRRLAAKAFGQKRKTILNNLRSSYPDAAAILDGADIDAMRRPETLTLAEWVRLASAVKIEHPAQ
jgi:16S rRNA (adenine1518-N6/adenine1519-N6)-dimethyltransferase